MSADLQSYKQISQTYKQLIQTLTTKQLPQIKLYLSNLNKSILSKQTNFLSQFHDIKHLLDSIKQAKGKLPIHFVVASAKIQVLAYLINTLKLDYNTKDKQQNTPFFTAVWHGHLPIVKYFIEELAVSPHSTKDGEIGVLHIAASQNDVQMLKYFLEKGCDIQKISIYGKPINWALGNKSEQAAKLLLENGADANGDPTCPAPAPIILAVDFQLPSTYYALLHAPKPANIKTKDPQGYSLLHLSAQKGNLKLVKQLVQNGLQVNQQIQGKTPLELAFQQNKWDVVNFLKNFTNKYEQILKRLQQQKHASSQIAHPPDKTKSEELKKQGNNYFLSQKFQQAIQKYNQGLYFDPTNDAIHRNLAACYLNLHQYNQALVHCHHAKLGDPKNVKNLYREAQAYIGLGNLMEACACFWECAILQPQTIFFTQEFKKYVELAKKQHQNK